MYFSKLETFLVSMRIILTYEAMEHSKSGSSCSRVSMYELM